jgi:hypothetical protein
MKLKTLLSMVVLMFALTGCASQGVNYDESHVSDIVDGKTTMAEVKEWFGEPQMYSQNSKFKDVFTYQYIETTANPVAMIPFVSLFVKSVDATHKALMIFFDEKGVVEEHSLIMGTM